MKQVLRLGDESIVVFPYKLEAYALQSHLDCGFSDVQLCQFIRFVPVMDGKMLIEQF